MDILLAAGVLCFVVLVFIFEWIRVDGVGLTVAVAASNSFLLPTNPVNALIMRPGGYRTADFMRAGSGVTALYPVVLIAVLAVGYGG